MSYEDFLVQLDLERAKTAQFFLADLHVHTHDSSDYATTAEDIEPEDLEKSLTESEKQWKQEGIPVPLNDYVDAININLPKLNIVAITDHGVCDVACELSHLGKSDCLILPGIEIKARVTQISESDTIHVLCIFDPSKNSQTIWGHLSPNSNYTYRNSAEEPFDIPDLPSYIRNHIHANNGICIAAHIDENNGFRKHFFYKSSRKFVDLKTRYKVLKKSQDELVKIVKTRDDPSWRAELSYVTKRIEELEQQQADTLGDISQHQYELQKRFLELISDCGFDALQVHKPSDGEHYGGEHTRALGILPIATILSSDAHYMKKIGSKYTWIKMAGLSFEGLRRALGFPVCRVRLGDYEKPKYPKILGLRFVPDEEAPVFFMKEGSKYSTVSLSDNLNCLIGGRGSGKSAIIDALKLIFKNVTSKEIALAQRIRSENDHERLEQLPDWMQRLVATMSKTKIEIAFQSEGNELPCERFIMSLYFDFRFETKSKIFDCSGNETGATVADPKFEVDVYGWHEIEKLGESREAQRKLLDRFARTEEFLSGIDQALKELIENRENIKTLASEISTIVDCEELQQYEKRKTEYDYYNKPEVAFAFSEVDIIEKRQGYLNSFKQTMEKILKDIEDSKMYETIETACNNLITALSSLSTLEDSDDIQSDEEITIEVSRDDVIQLKKEDNIDKNDDTLIKKIIDDLKLSDKDKLERIRKLVNSLISEIKEYHDSCDVVLSELTQTLKQKLAAIISDAEGTDASHKEQRQRARQRFHASDQKLDELNNKNIEISKFLKTRLLLRNQLIECSHKRTSARKKIVQHINQELEKKVNSKLLTIKVDLGEQIDRADFKQRLFDIIHRTGSRLHYREQKAEILSKSLTPEKVKESLLDTLDRSIFVFDGANMQTKISEVQASAIVDECNAKKTLFSDEKSNKSVQYYDPEMIDEILKLDEIVFNDIPDITLQIYTKDESQPASITNLSPGQRCSALLPIILLRGNCPVVIDQPEDNLDNRLICDVVVDVLQRLKEYRQIIVATHNPNIPVSGDAEQVIVTEALSRRQGRIAEQGPVDNDQIIRQIKDIMEGGEEAFRLRAKRYNYEIRSILPAYVDN